MNLRFVVSFVLVCAALLVGGCDDGRKAPGKVTVQVANMAPGFGSLSFQREQESRNAAELPFKSQQTYAYDADTYDFFVVERTLSDADPGRTWTFAPTRSEEHTSEPQSQSNLVCRLLLEKKKK